VASAREGPRPALQEYAAFVEAPRGGCVGLIDEAFALMKKRTGDAKLAPSTLKQYGDAATRLKKILKEFAPEQVRPKHIATIKRSMQATPNMANRILSFGRQVFDYGLEDQRSRATPSSASSATRRGSARGCCCGRSGGRSAPRRRAGCSSSWTGSTSPIAA
jgi:hypothetical protein